jgi:hypothetical protein
MKYNFLVSIYSIRAEYNIIHPWQNPQLSHGSCTGYCVEWNKKKYILTNDHCLGQMNLYAVALTSPTRYPCKIISNSALHDLALLESDITNVLDPVVFDDELPKDDEEYTLYSIHDSNLHIVRGFLRSIIQDTYGGLRIIYRLELNSIHGDSGAPVFSKSGKVIGSNYASYEEEYGSLVLPYIFVVKDFFERIDLYIKTKQQFYYIELRIWVQYLTTRTTLCKYLGVEDKGVLVSSIRKTSMLYDTLKPLDVIQKINDIEINSAGRVYITDIMKAIGFKPKPTKPTSANLATVDIEFYISLLKPGEQLTLNIVRNKEHKTIKTQVMPTFFQIPPYNAKPISFLWCGIEFMEANHSIMSQLLKMNSITAKDERTIFWEVKDKFIVLTAALALFPAPSLDTIVDGVARFVHTVNDIEVESINHLKTLLKNNTEQYIKIKYYLSETILVIDTKDIKNLDKEVYFKNF